MTCRLASIMPVDEGGHSRQSPLRVLVLDEWIPYPPDSGKRVRSWNLLRRLARRHHITLLCYGDPDTEAAHTVSSAGITLQTVTPLPDITGLTLYFNLLGNLLSRYPYSVDKHDTRRFREKLRGMVRVNEFDLVHYEWSPYACFMDEAAGVPSLVMAHNIESQIWLRRAQHGPTAVHRSYFGLQAQRMKAFEQVILEKADEVAAVTALDAEQCREWGAKRVSIVENGVDLDEFRPSNEPTEPNEILCLGSLDWQPNLDAVQYLIDEILPQILKLMPEAKLRIVGRRPPTELREKVAENPQIELVGEVADVRPYFARGTVVVVPLRIGGGSRIKILESMAMGKSIVSTGIGAEGLVVKDGEHLLLADSPEDFARRTVDLIRSPELRAKLGENGRKLVEERYGWDCAARVLESAWLRVAGGNAPIQNGPTSVGKDAKVSP